MDEEKLNEVCKIGQGADCCRYLVVDGDDIDCGKNDPELKAMIDERVEEGKFTARGDNCEGE